MSVSDLEPIIEIEQSDFIAGLFLDSEDFEKFRDTLEKEKKDRNLYQRIFQIVDTVAGIAAFYGYFNVTGKKGNNSFFFALSLSMMVAAHVAQYILDRRRPRPRVMKRIVACMNCVDSARGTVPGSRERIILAKRFVTCSGVLKIFASGHWNLGFTDTILRKRAGRISKAVRDLAYPALLGTDRDLGFLKQVLGEITYMISINNWVDIITVIPTNYRHDRVKGVELSGILAAFNFTFVAMAAIPAIPLIIEVFK